MSSSPAIKSIALTLTLNALGAATVLAAPTNPYALPDAPGELSVSSQYLDKQVFRQPGVYDGLAIDVAAGGQFLLGMDRNASWESGSTLLDPLYQAWTVTGTSTAQAFSVRTQSVVNCPELFDVRIRTLDVTNATFYLPGAETTCPTTRFLGPINFAVSGTASAPGVITLNGADMDFEFRPMTSVYGLDINTYGNSALNNVSTIGGNPLRISVSPGSTLAIHPASGSSQFTTNAQISVDAATLALEIAGGANGTATIGSSVVSGQSVGVVNGGLLTVGNGAATQTWNFNLGGNDALAVTDSSAVITEFATLNSNLALTDGQVSINADGALLSGAVSASGQSALRFDAASLSSRIDAMQVQSGATLSLSGGLIQKFGYADVLGTLVAGDVVNSTVFEGTDKEAGTRYLTPKPEILVASGGRLAGFFSLSAAAEKRAVILQAGSVLDPGVTPRDTVELSINAELFLEAANVLVDADAAQVAAGGLVNSDVINLTAPHGYLHPSLGGDTQLNITISNDQVLPDGTYIRPLTYPQGAWNGAEFDGLSDGSVVTIGANRWRVDYDAALAPGLDIIPVRSLRLTVVSPSLTVLPATTLDLGTAALGTTSQPTQVTLRNDGSAGLTITALALQFPDGSGANPDYTLASDSCTGTTLSQGAACTFSVTFSPVSVGNDVAVLQVNGSNSAVLTGRGVPSVGGGSVTLTPPITTFNTAKGASDTAVLTLSNQSGAALSALTLSISQLSSDFSVLSTSCGTSLASGASCSVTVAFSPQALGQRNGVLEVKDGGTTVSNAALLGQGAATSMAVSPASLAFPDQSVGATTGLETRTVTVTNSGAAGADSLVISSISVSRSDYVLSNDTCLGGSIAVGASCTVDVTFSPQTAGDDAAALSIVSNAVNSPQVVTMSGIGLSAAYTLSLQRLDFGSVAIGSQSAPLTETVTNTGTGDLLITQVAVSNSEFNITADTCSSMTIPPGGSCTISVVAEPTQLHQVAGALRIDSNASQPPGDTQLTATGIEAPKMQPTPVPVNLGALGLLLLSTLMAGIAVWQRWRRV